jgi:transcriptional regulator of acetoin/glycerol metabolism
VVPIDAAIREQVERALAASGGNRTKAASLLGIPRTTLYVYLDRFGLRRPGPRPPA